MVTRQLQDRGITDPRVLAALGRVPRHRFVPADLAPLAYGDFPLPIGQDQTISQPYIVALMSQWAEVRPGEKVLEVGTGSGYQAAVLAELTEQVFTIEIKPELARAARALLKELGYARVQVRTGDGYQGWPEAAPFDAILVTAAAPKVPPALTAQLKEGGRLVIPLGEPRGEQTLVRLRKVQGELKGGGEAAGALRAAGQRVSSEQLAVGSWRFQIFVLLLTAHCLLDSKWRGFSPGPQQPGEQVVDRGGQAQGPAPGRHLGVQGLDFRGPPRQDILEHGRAVGRRIGADLAQAGRGVAAEV